MKPFLKSKLGMCCVSVFVVMMAFMLRHVLQTKTERESRVHAMSAAAPNVSPPTVAVAQASIPPIAKPSDHNSDLAENAAYLDQLYQLENRLHQTHDPQGNPVTHRANASTPTVAGHAASEDDETAPTPPSPSRTSHRLQGRSNMMNAAAAAASPSPRLEQNTPAVLARLASTEPRPITNAASVFAPKPTRFNPYGNVLKCELVFTIDSTNEQTPLVGIVMEPVYNNGQLVIPPGTELHGSARPDRLRDRIFSGTDWVLVFPRERNRPNGRQLTVHGVALDRVEPDANGMTWGITDGSYGLEGTVIRTSQEEEIKRFAATFFSQAAETLEERGSGRGSGQTVRNTPQNAMLQGLAANLDKLSQDISAEIAQHGVFIRVPAGHQFYFYPMQIIDPEVADLSSNIATVQ